MAIARDHLRTLVERIESCEEEKKASADDIKEIYAEAKSHGFDTKAIRRIVRMRKQLPDERVEEEKVLGTYMAALGMASHLDVDDVDEALDRKRTEAGKSKSKPAAAKPGPPPAPPPGPRLSPEQVKAAADRAEARAKGTH